MERSWKWRKRGILEALHDLFTGNSRAAEGSSGEQGVKEDSGEYPAVIWRRTVCKTRIHDSYRFDVRMSVSVVRRKKYFTFEKQQSDDALGNERWDRISRGGDRDEQQLLDVCWEQLFTDLYLQRQMVDSKEEILA